MKRLLPPLADLSGLVRNYRKRLRNPDLARRLWLENARRAALACTVVAIIDLAMLVGVGALVLVSSVDRELLFVQAILRGALAVLLFAAYGLMARVSRGSRTVAVVKASVVATALIILGFVAFGSQGMPTAGHTVATMSITLLTVAAVLRLPWPTSLVVLAPPYILAGTLSFDSATPIADLFLLTLAFLLAMFLATALTALHVQLLASRNRLVRSHRNESRMQDLGRAVANLIANELSLPLSVAESLFEYVDRGPARSRHGAIVIDETQEMLHETVLTSDAILALLRPDPDAGLLQVGSYPLAGLVSGAVDDDVGERHARTVIDVDHSLIVKTDPTIARSAIRLMMEFVRCDAEADAVVRIEGRPTVGGVALGIGTTNVDRAVGRCAPAAAVEAAFGAGSMALVTRLLSLVDGRIWAGDDEFILVAVFPSANPASVSP